MEITYNVLLLVCFSVLIWESYEVDATHKWIGSIKKADAYLSALSRIRPGQVMPNLCAFSMYGCCRDFKTFAEGDSGISCEEKLCHDKVVGYCFENRYRLDCRRGSHDSTNCPFRCGKCKPAAPPIEKCLKTNPIYGCCWDGTIPLGRNGRGCRPCIDVHFTPCRIFKNIAGGCNSGSYGIRTYMTKFCPKTCGYCEEASFSQLQRRHKKRHHRR